jgi:hypothetical protein
MPTPTTSSQKAKILEHLKQNGTINPLQALNLYGCFRLAARIKDLRNDGNSIKSIPWKTPGGATVAMYRFIPQMHQPNLL